MKILLICHFFSSYMKELIEQHNRYNGIIFDVATTDSSYKNKVSSKAIGNIFLFKDYQSFRELMSAVEYYDVIEIHYLDTFYSMHAELIRSKCEILNCCVWGSDYYRVSEEDKKNQKKLYDLADHIIFGNPSTLSDFNEDFKYEESKLKVCQFGLSVLEEIDKVNDQDVFDFKSKYHIKNSKKLIVIGHNASPAQQHELIIHALMGLSPKILKKCHFVFPMTYGRNPEYVKKIENYLNTSFLTFTVLNDYMTVNEVSILRKATDIFIQLQTTDQISGSMLEHLYAGNYVITGSWLPYKFIDDKGVFTHKIKDNLELCSALKNAIGDKKDDFYEKNRRIISEMSSWKNVARKWIKLYEHIDDEKNIQSDMIMKNILLLLEKHRFQEVKDILERYILVAQKNAKFYSFISSVYYSIEDYLKAYDILNKGLVYIRNDFDMWYNFFIVCQKLNIKKGLFQSLSHLKKLAVLDEDIEEVKLLIEKYCPVITIGIANYNYAHFIETCVNSCLNQGYPNIKIIIVDDCSTDNSVDIICSLSKKHDNIFVVKHEENKGTAVYAFQEIIEKVNEGYLMFLSADDYLYGEEEVLDFIEILEGDPDVDYVYGNLLTVDKSGSEISLWRYDQFSDEDVIKRTFTNFGSGPLPFTSGIHRVDYFKKNNLTWYHDESNISASDVLNVLVKIKQKWNYKFLDKTLIQYRQHESNITLNLKERISSTISVIEYIIKNFDEKLYLDFIDWNSLEESKKKGCKLNALFRYYCNILRYYYEGRWSAWGHIQNETGKKYLLEALDPLFDRLNFYYDEWKSSELSENDELCELYNDICKIKECIKAND